MEGLIFTDANLSNNSVDDEEIHNVQSLFFASSSDDKILRKIN